MADRKLASLYPAIIDARVGGPLPNDGNGTHGHSGPVHLLLDNVAEYVIRAAMCRCPLFVCVGHKPNAGCGMEAGLW